MADLSLKAQCQEAQRLVSAGNHKGATALCHRILDAFPKHIATHGVLGQALLGMGEHEQASTEFRRVLSADPEDAVAYASLGAIYVERGLVEEAIWQMGRAFELSPRNGEIRRALRDLHEKRGGLHTRRVKMTRGSLARAYLRGQLYPKVIGELRDIVRQNPHRFDLRVALAQALWWDRRDEDATVVCQGILGDLPNCLKAGLILGQVWLNTEQDEQARSVLQVCQALDPDNDMAQSLLGARSPLPPRVARLPLENGDVPPLDLPYLLNDDSFIGGAQAQRAGIIDGQSTIIKSERPLIAEPPPDAAQRPSLSPAEARRSSDPDSRAALGLSRARRHRDEGLVGTALDSYEELIERYPELRDDVAEDLELLQTLYPANRRVQNLLRKLQDVAPLDESV